jgi:hypothetical protein
VDMDADLRQALPLSMRNGSKVWIWLAVL